MIGNEIKEMLLEKKEDFLIDGDKVASLLDTHPLSHAFLVLTKVKYSKIPVLNKDDELVGFIGLADVVNGMLAIDGVDFSLLEGQCVADIMDTEIQSITSLEDVELLFHLAVDHAFITVVDADNHFVGIVTRRELFKAVNHLIHNLDDEYALLKKAELKLAAN